MTALTFEFVNDSQPLAHKDRDALTRHRMRKQATKAAAITKKRQAGTLSQRRLNQLGTRASTPKVYIHELADATAFLPSAAVQETIFAKLHGQLDAPYVKLSKLLALCSPEFVALLQESTGHVPYLDQAVACLRARIRETVGCVAMEDDPMTLYARAITSFKQTFNDRSVKPTEAWLAAICLTLFELLDTCVGGPAFMIHAKGAFGVLQGIGPENLTTEVQMTMLATSASVITTETLHWASRGVLDQAPWQAAIKRTILKNTACFHPRSELVVSAQLLRHRIPGLFADVTDIIMHGWQDGLSSTVRRASDLCEAYQGFLAEYHEYLRTPTSSRENLDRIGTLEVTLSSASMTYRLLSALHPHQPRLEASALALASEALANPDPDHSCERIYHRWVARSIVTTSEDWHRGLLQSSQGGMVVDSATFQSWCNTLGRLN
jgi:hypothetical protein